LVGVPDELDVVDDEINVDLEVSNFLIFIFL